MKTLPDMVMPIIMVLGTCIPINFYIARSHLTSQTLVRNKQVKEAFVTNSNYLIPISLQPDVVEIWHFKSRLFELTECIVRTIEGLRYLSVKI